MCVPQSRRQQRGSWPQKYHQLHIHFRGSVTSSRHARCRIAAAKTLYSAPTDMNAHLHSTSFARPPGKNARAHERRGLFMVSQTVGGVQVQARILHFEYVRSVRTPARDRQHDSSTLSKFTLMSDGRVRTGRGEWENAAVSARIRACVGWLTMLRLAPKTTNAHARTFIKVLPAVSHCHCHCRCRCRCRHRVTAAQFRSNAF